MWLDPHDQSMRQRAGAHSGGCRLDACIEIGHGTLPADAICLLLLLLPQCSRDFHVGRCAVVAAAAHRPTAEAGNAALALCLCCHDAVAQCGGGLAGSSHWQGLHAATPAGGMLHC